MALITLSSLALHHQSPRLWLLAAAGMADVVRAVALVARVVASRTSAVRAIASITSCRHVRPRALPS
jgi:hypothetical protein